MGLNPHATVLLFLTPVRATNKVQPFHTQFYALHTPAAGFLNWA